MPSKTQEPAQPAAKRQTSMSALLQQRSADVEVAPRPAPAAPSAENLDEGDRLDNRAAAEYVGQIYNYYRRVEPLYRVSPSYMAKQVRLPRQLLVLWWTDCIWMSQLYVPG